MQCGVPARRTAGRPAVPRKWSFSVPSLAPCPSLPLTATTARAWLGMALMAVPPDTGPRHAPVTLRITAEAAALTSLSAFARPRLIFWPERGMQGVAGAGRW